MKSKVFLPTATLSLDVAVASEISYSTPPASRCSKIDTNSISKGLTTTGVEVHKSRRAKVLPGISDVAYPFHIFRQLIQRAKTISFDAEKNVNHNSTIKGDGHGSSWADSPGLDWINTQEFKIDFFKCLSNAKDLNLKFFSGRQAMHGLGHPKANPRASQSSLEDGYPRAGTNYPVFASYFNFHSPFISFLFPIPEERT